MKLSELINFQSNKERLEEIRKNRTNIIPFVGAGISKGCGLYTWGELLHELALDYLTEDEIYLLESKGNYFEYADKIIDVSKNSDMIMKRIREIFSKKKILFTEIPFLLVSSFSQMVVTTNYDTILEDASLNSPLGLLKPLLPCLVGQVNEAIQINDRKLLKLHGSVEETQSFIFSTEQYRKFYGKKGDRNNRLLPEYLMKIFAGKKVLFVGCSLDRDYTLEILEECIAQNRSISHYAIVPYPADSNEQIMRKRELTRLGIEPIYYPEGDFFAVNRLINYLAEENHFISSVNQILIENFGDDVECSFQIKMLVSILKESFYKTALKFPQLLDIDNLKENFIEDILEYIGTARKQEDTVLNMCIDAFLAYVKVGYLRCEKETVNFFTEQFENEALKETDIASLLIKRWSIEYNLPGINENTFNWIAKLSDKEINDYAYDLLQKLQYRNGMNFAEIVPVYELAKQFVGYVAERIDFDIKIRLLNSLGAFGHYFKDGKVAITYLEWSINEINNSGRIDRELMLFKAKCYSNLAMARAFTNADISTILEAAEKDIILKRKYNESEMFYSRSLNFYATMLKEINPFMACDVYFEVAEIKEKLISDSQDAEKSKEMVASWATTIFNIGLLAKDMELYEMAYRIICYANKYRFKTVDYHNRDYCSSINVRAELELFVHEKQNIEWLINGVESRIDLPLGFADTLAHTWYICAYHYYLKKEYYVAIKYVNKAIGVSKKEGALVDFRQDMRTKLLLGDIKAAQGKFEKVYLKEAETIYMDIIENITAIYGKDSYFLVSPYRHLIQMLKIFENKKEYSVRYNKLVKKYMPEVEKMKRQIDEYVLCHCI